MRLIVGTLCLIASTLTCAQLPVVGEILPAVSIDDKGSLELEGDEMHYKPWSTTTLRGKPAYLQHMAARAGIDGINKLLDDAVEAKGYSPEQLRSAAIVNKDDAIWGSGVFVTSQLKKNKRRYPESTIIVDDNGTALKQWRLEKKNSAVVILSPEGRVVFFKQGALSAAEVTKAVAILVDQVEH